MVWQFSKHFEVKLGVLMINLGAQRATTPQYPIFPYRILLEEHTLFRKKCGMITVEL